jgi:hypothetical protein
MAQPTNTDPIDGDEFREAMPAMAEGFHQTAPEDNGRFIAVVTLVLVAMVVLALALLLWRGLDTIRRTVPQPAPAPAAHQSDSSGTLEL